MTQSTSSVSIEQIIKFLANEFIATDNIPEDFQKRDQICMEARASILIDSCSMSELARFFRTNIENDTLELKLPRPLILETTVSGRGKGNYRWKFTHCKITASDRSADFLKQTRRWRISGIPPEPIPLKNTWESKPSQEETCLALLPFVSPTPDAFYPVLIESKEELCNDLQEYFRQHSIFQLARPSTEYNTPERVCQFFGNIALPFASLKQSGYQLRQEYALEYVALEPHITGKEEYEAVYEYLSRMFSAAPLPWELLQKNTKSYEGWLTFIFPFTDENNRIVMTVIKQYDRTFQQKSFLPITGWGRNGSAERYCLAVPCPKLQPLYHLYELRHHEGAIVILTDSLEIAELNQTKWQPHDVIFTGFICDPGQYEQVDWSPLKDRKQVYYLISNHSGKTFETACLEAGKLAEFLKSKSIDLQFIRMPIWYRPLPVLHNIQELISAYRISGLQLYKEDIRILMSEEFEMLRQIAEQRITMPPEAWWQIGQEASVSPRQSSETPSTSERFNYILWPLLIRGKSTMLHAPKGIGKSALAHSIAACLCRPDKPRLFAENWWGATKGNYNSYKVLYLDFENQDTGHQDILKRMCYPYWHTEKDKRAIDAKNFIWKNMPREGLAGINFTLSENHQKLWDMIDVAKNEGEPGHVVDLLIIDTYHEFTSVRDEEHTHQGLRTLLRTLEERKIAVLILNHSKSDKTTSMSGHKSILESFGHVMYLTRNNNTASQPLSEPITVNFSATRNGWLGANPDAFQIYQPESSGKWCLYSPKRTAAEELERIKGHYMKVEKFSKEEVAALLGTSVASLYRSIKNAKA